MVMSLSDRIYVMEYTAPASPQAPPLKSAPTPASSRPIWEKAMLELRNVDTYYGNIQALRDISLNIEEGEIVTLIRPTARANPPRL